MGKRSNFERREADFYPTPRAAVVPLIPYLRGRGIRAFAEPCAGDGALVQHLKGFGLRCVYAGDIRNGQDELDFTVRPIAPSRIHPFATRSPLPYGKIASRAHQPLSGRWPLLIGRVTWLPDTDTAEKKISRGIASMPIAGAS